jgi:hypothetical protein
VVDCRKGARRSCAGAVVERARSWRMIRRGNGTEIPHHRRRRRMRWPLSPALAAHGKCVLGSAA